MKVQQLEDSKSHYVNTQTEEIKWVLPENSQTSEFEPTQDQRFLLHKSSGYYYEIKTGICWEWNPEKATFEKVESNTTSHYILKLIVTKSKSIPKGSVLSFTKHLKIGRDVEGGFILDELEVSRFHCVFYYRKQKYYIADVGSSHGTYLNSKLLSQNKEASVPVVLKHKDYITIGSTEFLAHLHDPCKQCQKPAYIQHRSKPNERHVIPRYKVHRLSKKMQMEFDRVDEISRLKAQFGIQDEHGLDSEFIKRNQIYGNEARNIIKNTAHPYIRSNKVIPSSVDKKIDGGIGQEMLKKMGWEGKGLGAQQHGILDPIKPSEQKGKTGLSFKWK